MSTKAGRRHNAKDQEKIDKWHKAADELKADMADLGAAIEQAQEDAQDNGEQAAAKGADIHAEDLPVFIGAVKAAGDWELDVLYMPYGGPNGGKDAHGEYFSVATKEHADKFPSPLILYYHGHTPEGKPQGEPEVIGQAVKRWADGAGRWMRVKLDQTKALAAKMIDAARRGAARVSSGSISHLVRKQPDGHITNWPVVEISLIDAEGKRQPANQYAVAMPAAKALYEKAGQTFPELSDENAEPQATGAVLGNKPSAAEQSANVKPTQSTKGVFEMDENDLIALLDKRDAQRKAQEAAEAERKAQEQERIDAAVKAAQVKWEADHASGRRLPLGGEAPYQTKFSDVAKFDNLEAADIALLTDILGAQQKIGRSQGPTASALKALALRLESDEGKKDEYRVAAKALALTGIKANELNHTTQAGFGDEWIGIAYSTKLWEAIRQGTFVGAKLMGSAIEVPQGFESIYLPLEGADPTFYKVGETTDNNATTGTPNATVTASKVATGRQLLTLAKMGARTIWSGEMEEDSLIPFIAQLRKQLEVAGAETLEHVLIDGDTATGATTNINDIAGTPAGTEAFLLVNGFRKSPLVTTTANSRSAAGSLVAADFLETVKLMGLAGRNADKRYTEFIIDKWTGWKVLELPEVKTRDVFAQPTLENGELTGIYGYKVNTSAFMHWANQDATYGLKAQTDGKVDLDTASDNTRGAILAVRYDQWQFGFKRRMTIETARQARSDSSEIVALMRFGLVQRDTEASAISYNVGV